MRVRHAIQVSEMNAHFSIFKSDTIYAVTIHMRGIGVEWCLGPEKSQACIWDVYPRHITIQQLFRIKYSL